MDPLSEFTNAMREMIWAEYNNSPPGTILELSRKVDDALKNAIEAQIRKALSAKPAIRKNEDGKWVMDTSSP